MDKVQAVMVLARELKNAGVDSECGSCMEVFFTGSTTTTHTCDFRSNVHKKAAPAVVEKLREDMQARITNQRKALRQLNARLRLQRLQLNAAKPITILGEMPTAWLELSRKLVPAPELTPEDRLRVLKALQSIYQQSILTEVSLRCPWA